MSASEDREPRLLYQERLRARRDEAARLQARDRLLGILRLVTFAAGIGVVWAAMGPRLLPSWATLLPLFVFVALVIAHARALEARRLVERGAGFYARGLDRLDHKWAGTGTEGTRFDDPHHPYARDLDLFGKGSLFELLCTTRTQAGEETLAAWLKAPAAAAEVRARQAAVAELRPAVALREDLAVLGTEVRAEVDPAALTRWAQAAPSLTQPAWRPLLLLLAVAAVVTIAGWLALDWGWTAIAVVAAVELLVSRALRDRVDAVAGGVENVAPQLEVLAQVMRRLERERWESPRLRTLVDRLREKKEPASLRIAELSRLAHLLSARRNQFFAPFGFFLMWSQQLAFAVEKWRACAGRGIGAWLEALGELEALAALAGHAFEHPRDVFPEILDAREAPHFDGAGLGHPLLPEDACVRNEVRLDGARPLLLVSGSNMSGKSTLLRTVGANAVLALAGAPVRATRLQLTPLQVGATLRVQDSLAEGASRFYAEITRLRQLVELAAGAPPLLFLLDEILAGTNSHDRRIGAEAVVRALVQAGACGLCTTHDLALTELAASLDGRAENVHFEDTLVDGKLVFDYRMRPGVVQRSNALALMRAVGLKV